jgi:hypothetical protein
MELPPREAPVKETVMQTPATAPATQQVDG